MNKLAISQEFGKLNTFSQTQIIKEISPDTLRNLAMMQFQEPYCEFDSSTTTMEVKEYSQNTGTTCSFEALSNSINHIRNIFTLVEPTRSIFTPIEHATSIFSSIAHISRPVHFLEQSTVNIMPINEVFTMFKIIDETTEKFQISLPLEKITDEYLELNLNEYESEKLIERLEKGSSKEAKKFIKKSIKFYAKMKRKQELHKKNNS
jgi:hypothetical protein